jgi:hypothetical protein
MYARLDEDKFVVIAFLSSKKEQFNRKLIKK